MPQHVKKLPDGRVVECKCGMCRTSLRGEEVLEGSKQEPNPYIAFIPAILVFLGLFCLIIWKYILSV